MNLIAAQPDLFGEAGLAGLSQTTAIVTPGEEQMLTASVDAAELSPFRFHGWLGKRLTASLRLALRLRRCQPRPGRAYP